MNTITDEITITLRASDARVMGDALLQLRRDWADERDAAIESNDEAGASVAAINTEAAERVGKTLFHAGWEAA